MSIRVHVYNILDPTKRVDKLCFRLTLRLTVCIEKVNRLNPLTWIWKGRLEELRTLHSLSAFRLEVPLAELRMAKSPSLDKGFH